MTTRNSTGATPPHIVELVQKLAAPGAEDIVCDLNDLDRVRTAGRCAPDASHAVAGQTCTLVLATAPGGSKLDNPDLAKALRRLVKSRRQELLCIGLAMLLLKPGGRGVLIVPESVLFGATQAHRELRRRLIEEHSLEGVIRLPAGALRPGTHSAAAILLFRKSGTTDAVWFYELRADGWSLNSRRQPLLAADKLGAVPRVMLSAEEHASNNLPDVLSRWPQRDGAERERPRSAQSFCVPRALIAAPAFALRLDMYRSSQEETLVQQRPHEILADIAGLEAQILQGIRELVGWLK